MSTTVWADEHMVVCPSNGVVWARRGGNYWPVQEPGWSSNNCVWWNRTRKNLGGERWEVGEAGKRASKGGPGSLWRMSRFIILICGDGYMGVSTCQNLAALCIGAAYTHYTAIEVLQKEKKCNWQFYAKIITPHFWRWKKYRKRRKGTTRRKGWVEIEV